MTLPVNETSPDDLIILIESIEQDIATATQMRDRWARHLAAFRATGGGRLRIGGMWETMGEAEKRLQTIVDHHARTIELLEGFRYSFPDCDN